MTDLRHAVRGLARQRTFSISIILILTLASAAVAVILAVAQAVILRPLPYRDSGRLTVIWERDRQHGNVIEIAHRNYVDWRERAKSFESLAAYGSVNWSRRLTGRGEPTTIPGAGVSASFFDVLAVPPLGGRVLRDEDDRTNAAPVAVIGDGLRRRLFGDGGGVGQRLILDDTPVEIVGVMPREFAFPAGAEMWFPVVPVIASATPQIKTDALQARWFGVLYVVGRLQPEATLDQARQELDALDVEIERVNGSFPPHAVVTTPLERRVLGNTRPALLLLMAAVALMLLIACANVATLLLMRAARRHTETAVRLSLGASPRHLYRLWAVDALVRFLSAGVAGLILANLLLPFVIRLAPDTIYRIGDARLTMPIIVSVVAMLAVAALVTAALVTSLTPLWRRLTAALRESGAAAASMRMRRARRLLVSGEMAIACVLLVGAGLTIRSFLNLRALDLGFEPEGVLTIAVGPSNAPGDANAAFYAPLLERIAALPDVVRSGGVSLRPLLFDAVGVDSRVLSDQHPSTNTDTWMEHGIPVNRETVSPGYFDAMRIALVDGRYFDATDTAAGAPVTIISESAARRIFPGQRAIGRRLASGGEYSAADGTYRMREVVGVVRDVRYRGLTDVRFDFYLPFTQNDDGVKHLVVAARGNPVQVYAQIAGAVRALDSRAVIDDVHAMEEVVNGAVAPWRLNMVLFAVLGALGLAVALIGVYGVVRVAIVERWHELGVRAALGASQRQLMSAIAGEGSRLVAIGIATGAGAAWMLTRAMTSILFGVEATDAPTFVAVAGGLAVVAGAAAYLPARAAGRADPSALLRSL